LIETGRYLPSLPLAFTIAREDEATHPFGIKAV
jgi:DNA-binding XRE family transcriptional regulator